MVCLFLGVHPGQKQMPRFASRENSPASVLISLSGHSNWVMGPCEWHSTSCHVSRKLLKGRVLNMEERVFLFDFQVCRMMLSVHTWMIYRFCGRERKKERKLGGRAKKKKRNIFSSLHPSRLSLLWAVNGQSLQKQSRRLERSCCKTSKEK